MKYDILDKLREYLEENYPKNTAKKYYFAVVSLLKDYEFNFIEQIEATELEKRLSKLRTKNDFSAAKRGLLELKECFPLLLLPDDDFFKQTVSHKRNYKKRVFQPLQLDKVKRKINAIRDKRLKVAYRLMLRSGARVAEVAALNAENIIIDDNDTMQIKIINGKGGKDRTVDVLADDYLKKELAELTASSGPDEPVFYSDGHMIKKAGQLGFECHDLRRAFSQEYRAKCRETDNAYTANGKVMEALGHTRFRVTRRYLDRKITFRPGEH